MQKEAEETVQLLKINKFKKPRNRLSNEPLTKEEVHKLISSVTNLRDRTLLILGFNTGMRVSEPLTITEPNINWQELTITIWDAKKRKYRQVRVPSSTLNHLKLYLTSEGNKEQQLFPFSTKTSENIIQSWSEQVLGKKKSWHCLRHTYITQAAIDNLPISIVAENTGDSPSTLWKYYIQIPPQLKKELIEKSPVYSEG